MATNLPTISTDCNNKLTTVHVGEATYYFSYTTCVGVRVYTEHSVINAVSVNVWSQTTGRHLNAISDKDNRLPHDLFLRVLGLVSKGDKRSLTTAQRLVDTHRSLVSSGLRAVV